MTTTISLRTVVDTYDPSSQVSWEFLRDLYRSSQKDRLDKLISSIREVGVHEPIVLDDETMTVVDGQHRVIAAVLLGLKELPWIPYSEWNEPV